MHCRDTDHWNVNKATTKIYHINPHLDGKIMDLWAKCFPDFMPSHIKITPARIPCPLYHWYQAIMTWLFMADWWSSFVETAYYPVSGTIFIAAHVSYGPLARYVKWWIAHAPGMPGTFSPSPRVSDPDMHHGTCVTHVPWFMAGSLTSGFLWSRWRGKRSRHSRRMRSRNLAYLVRGPHAVLPLV